MSMVVGLPDTFTTSKLADSSFIPGNSRSVTLLVLLNPFLLILEQSESRFFFASSLSL